MVQEGSILLAASLRGVLQWYVWRKTLNKVREMTFHLAGIYLDVKFLKGHVDGGLAVVRI